MKGFNYTVPGKKPGAENTKTSKRSTPADSTAKKRKATSFLISVSLLIFFYRDVSIILFLQPDEPVGKLGASSTSEAETHINPSKQIAANPVSLIFFHRDVSIILFFQDDTPKVDHSFWYEEYEELKKMFEESHGVIIDDDRMVRELMKDSNIQTEAINSNAPVEAIEKVVKMCFMLNYLDRVNKFDIMSSLWHSLSK